MENGVLNSWKEIATYTGRGVRTVQRWEQDLGFPIRRPRGKQRSAVIAIKQEIDLWMRTPHGEEAQRRRHQINFENQKRLLDNAETLRVRATVLLRRYEDLSQQVARAIQLASAMTMSRRAARMERRGWARELTVDSHTLQKNMARASGLGIALQNSVPPPHRRLIWPFAEDGPVAHLGRP